MNLPLESYKVLKSRDLDEIRERVSNAYCSHSLQLKSRSGHLNTKHHRVSFGDVSFNYLQYGADVKINSGEFERFFMFEIPLSGTAKISYGKEEVVSRKNMGSLVSPTRSMHSEWSADAKRLMVQVDRSVMERFATNLLGHALNKPLDFKLEFDLSHGVGAGLRSYVEYVINQLSTDNYFDQYVLVRKQVERTILAMLLNGQENNYSEQVKAIEAPGAPKYIERAYEYIMAHYDEDISVEQLAKIAGVSVRALFAGFKRYKGVSPMVALKTKRLEAVHRELSSVNSKYSITTIAFRWGFSHMGNFAKDYYNTFGEKPSETRRKTVSMM